MFAVGYDIDVKMNLLTAAQTAKKLKVSKRRVLALIEAGRLPAVKFGFQFLIEPKDLARVQHRPTGWPKGKPRKPAKKRSGKS